MEIELYLTIEDLILEGLSDIDQEGLQESVTQALNQLIATNGLPNHLKQTTVLWDNKTLSAMPRTDAQGLGMKVAESIYRGR